MGDTLMLMVTYGEYTAVMRVLSNYVFSDVVDFVCRKWKNLHPESFVLYYALGPYSKCLLGSNDDFRSMLDLALHKGLTMLDVSVVSSEILCGRESSSGLTESSSSCLEVSRGEDVETNLLPTFCRHTTKPLLIATWKMDIRCVNQCFEGGVVDFRRSLERHAISVGYEYSYVRNEKDRVGAVCALKDAKNCEWSVYASLQKSNGYFYIRKLHNEHTCGAGVGLASNRRVSSDLVAREILEVVRVCPTTRPIEVVGYFKSTVGLDITYNHAWGGLEKARSELFGDHALSFDQLTWYFNEAMVTNPGSQFTIDCFEESSRFRRCFVCFDASVQGFKFCRPMLFLDGTFLKGRYRGTLLAATAKDGNQGLFPFAFAIVASEDEDNWTWFMEQLVKVVGNDRVITFISDQNAGLLSSVSKVFPNAHHAYCLEHLKRNLRDRLKGLSNDDTEKVIYLFRAAAYCPDESLMFKKLSAMKHIGGGPVIAFLRECPNEHWTNVFFRGNRYGEMSSNLAESFNNMIQIARDMPAVKCVDVIRLKSMKIMTDRRVVSATWTSLLTPYFDGLLQEAVVARATWNISVSTDNVYEVLSAPSVFVNIIARTCTCGQWQYMGFPCAHAVAAIVKSGRDIYGFIEPYFFSTSYRSCYAHSIGPVSTLHRPTSSSLTATIRPPITKKPVGRPRKRRMRQKNPNVRKITCSRCTELGHHNRATCNCVIE